MDKLKEAITRATEKSLSIVVLQTEDAKELEAKLQVAVEALEGVKSEYQGYKNAVESHYSQDWYPEIKMDAKKIENEMYVAMEFDNIANEALKLIKAK